MSDFVLLVHTYPWSSVGIFAAAVFFIYCIGEVVIDVVGAIKK